MGGMLFIPDSGAGGSGAAVPDDIYIATTGNDANDGLTTATPVATIARANAILEGAIGDTPLSKVVQFHFASGSYDFERIDMEYARLGILNYIGDGAGQGADDGFTEVATHTTSGAAPTPYRVVVAGPLVANAYVGYTLEVVATGQLVHISKNTTTDIYISDNLSLGAGQDIRILSPAVALNNPGTVPAQLGERANIALWNIRLTGTNAAGRSFQFNRSTIFTYGLSLYDTGTTNRVLWRSTNSYTVSGLASLAEDNDQLTALFAATGTSDISGWGLTAMEGLVANNPAWSPLGNAGGFNGYLIGSINDFQNLSNMLIIGGRITSGFGWGPGYISLSVSNYLNLCSSGSFNLVSNATLSIRAFAPGNRIEVDERTGNVFDIQDSTVVDENAAGSDGVIVTLASGTVFTLDGGSRLNLTETWTVTCTGTAEGINVQGESVAMFNALTLTASATTGLAARVQEQSKLAFNGTSNVTGIGMLVTERSALHLDGGNITLNSGAADNTLDVRANSSLVQTGGILSCTTTGDHALALRSGSFANLRGAANSVLTATGNALLCTGGSSAEFEAALSSVSGTGSDITVDASTVAVAALAAGGDFVSGIPAVGSPGNGGGSRVGRSA